MLKVLLISYYFPPLAGGGVYRPLKFAKYLERFGWQPAVLSVQSAPYHWASDPSLLDELSAGVHIHRTRSFEPDRLYTALYYLRLSRLSPWIHRMFFVPDKQIGWIPSAVIRGMRLIRQHNIKVIFTTSPPHSSHMIGYLLKQLTGVSWIADFRDHWTLSPMKSPQYPGLEAYLERTILNACDRIISVTQGNRKELIDAFNLSQDKVVCIPNGYDAEDFAHIAIPERPRNRPFTIIYTGSFYQKQSPEPFLLGLRLLLDREPRLADSIRFVFIGKAEDQYNHMIETFNPPEMIQTPGFLSHKESLRHLIEADALLFVLSTAPGFEHVLTTKLFDYLASGKPILALAPQGEAAQIISQASAGIVVDPHDTAAIADQIYSLYSRHQEGALNPTPDWDMIKQFERCHLTGILANLFNESVISTIPEHGS